MILLLFYDGSFVQHALSTVTGYVDSTGENTQDFLKYLFYISNKVMITISMTS